MDSPNDNAPPPLTDGTHRVSTSGDVEVSTYLGIAQERETNLRRAPEHRRSRPPEARGHRRYRLRLTVQQAHRAPRSRAERLLRTDLSHRAPRSRRRSRSEGHHSLRRPCLRLRGRRAAGPAVDIRERRAGARHLLRHAAARASAGRQRHTRHGAGVRLRRRAQERPEPASSTGWKARRPYG